MIAKIFGNKSDKDIKKMLPLVVEINSEFEKLNALTHDELRAQTQLVREDINLALKDIDDQIKAFHDQIDENPEMDV